MTDKLKHLSDSEVAQLIESYYAGVRVGELISKYQIDVLPGQLVKTFTPKKLGRNCAHCGKGLVEEYVSKTSYYGKAAASCLECGHNESGRCNCSNCKEAAKQALLAEEMRQEAMRQQMREQLEAALNSKKNQPVDYNELSFEQKIYLGAILRGGMDENYNYVRPIGEFNPQLAPTEKFAVEILDSLTKSQECLVISPISNLSAFTRKENGGFGFYSFSVSWMLNIYIDGLEKVNMIYYIMNPDKVEGTVEQKLELWRKIALEEALEDFLESIRILDPNFSAGEKTISAFKNVLKDYSVAQVYGIINNAISNASRYKLETRVSGKQAANSVVSRIVGNAERAKANGWVLTKWGRKRERPISTISRFYFEKVLAIGDLGFSACPSLEILEGR